MGGASAMVKNGVPLFPFFNNAGRTVWEVCEADFCNAHSGKGEDYHYHGDPYGEKCVYGPDDYDIQENHPPVVGYSLDGYPIHGRYNTDSGRGMNVDLDECNGHEHNHYGYHYHADQGTATHRSYTWTEFRLGPTHCWHGDINNIPHFWERTDSQANYDLSRLSPNFCPVSRSDYEDIRPCCGMTEYHAEPGLTLSTVRGECANGSCATTYSNSCGRSYDKGIIGWFEDLARHSGDLTALITTFFLIFNYLF